MKVDIVVRLAGGFFAWDDRVEGCEVELPIGATFQRVLLRDGTWNNKGKLEIIVQYKVDDDFKGQSVYVEKAKLANLLSFKVELL